MIGGGQHLEGFEVPIHGALGSPILLGGAPRMLAIVNGTLAAAVGLGLQQWLAGVLLWPPATASPCSLRGAIRVSPRCSFATFARKGTSRAEPC